MMTAIHALAFAALMLALTAAACLALGCPDAAAVALVAAFVPGFGAWWVAL